MNEANKARVISLTGAEGQEATPEVVAKIEGLLASGKAIEVSVDDLPPELSELQAELRAKGIKNVVAIPHKRDDNTPPTDIMAALKAAEENTPTDAKNFGLDDELVKQLAELDVTPAQFAVRARTKHEFTDNIASDFGRAIFSPKVADLMVNAGITTVSMLRKNPPDELRKRGISNGAIAMIGRGMYAIMEEGVGQTPEQKHASKAAMLKDVIEDAGGLDALFDRLGLPPDLIVCFERLASVTGADVVEIVTGDPNNRIQAAIEHAIETGDSKKLEAIQDAASKLTEEQKRLREQTEGGDDNRPLADDPNIVQLLPDDLRNPELAKVVGEEVVRALLEIGITSIEELMDDSNVAKVSEAMFALDPKAERMAEFQQRMQTGRALSSRCGCSHCIAARATYKASRFH